MANAAPASAVRRCGLNPQQREWLAQHPQLRVGVVLQAPYAQYDRRLQRLSGANVELMQALAKALNIELTWRNFPTQEQLEDALRDGVKSTSPQVCCKPLPACACGSFPTRICACPSRLLASAKAAAPWTWKNSMNSPGSPCACPARGGLPAQQLPQAEPARRAPGAPGLAIIGQPAGALCGGR